MWIYLNCTAKLSHYRISITRFCVWLAVVRWSGCGQIENVVNAFTSKLSRTIRLFLGGSGRILEMSENFHLQFLFVNRSIPAFLTFASMKMKRFDTAVNILKFWWKVCRWLTKFNVESLSYCQINSQGSENANPGQDEPLWDSCIQIVLLIWMVYLSICSFDEIG
jgi:hypothetical protein